MEQALRLQISKYGVYANKKLNSEENNPTK